MSPNPVTVRLLDPPMHEFLPTEHDLLEQIRTLSLYRDVVRGSPGPALMMDAPPLPSAIQRAQ